MGGEVVPEPFDVRTEEGTEAGSEGGGSLDTSHDSGRGSGNVSQCIDTRDSVDWKRKYNHNRLLCCPHVTIHVAPQWH